MARVNRTTGVFLLLGVIVLVGTVTGARLMMQPGDAPPQGPPVVTETSVYCSGIIDVASGMPNLVPGVPVGKVKTIFVREKDPPVKAGEPLVQLDDTQAQEVLKIARQTLVVSQEKLNAARKAAENQIHEYEVKLAQQQALVDNAAAGFDSARSKWKQAQEALKSKLISPQELDNTEHLMMMARTVLEGAKKVLEKLEAIKPKVELKQFEEEIREADLRVKAATKQLDAYVIRAPADGTVYELNYQVGGSAPLAPTDPNAHRALVFCPAGDLVVRAEIDQESAPLVKEGQKATLIYRTNKGDLTWTGKVERVAKYLQRRRAGIAGAAAFNDSRTRECIIRIDPNPKQAVFVGTEVSVQIHTK